LTGAPRAVAAVVIFLDKTPNSPICAQRARSKEHAAEREIFAFYPALKYAAGLRTDGGRAEMKHIQQKYIKGI
jgi:hypothetical protein